jgi:hypothetical protein
LLYTKGYCVALGLLELLRHAELGLRFRSKMGGADDFGLGGDVGVRPITTSSWVLGILGMRFAFGRGLFSGISGKAARETRAGLRVFSKKTRFRFA